MDRGRIDHAEARGELYHRQGKSAEAAQLEARARVLWDWHDVTH